MANLYAIRSRTIFSGCNAAIRRNFLDTLINFDSCTAPSSTLCNDDNCGGFGNYLSSLDAPGVLAGTTVFIVIESYLCSHGEYTLNISTY